MPGPNPAAAVEAFLDPLRDAVSCIGTAHITLSPRARGKVGETHAWTLNRGRPVALQSGWAFRAGMRFETLDLGQSEGRDRFRVTTREYIYSAELHGREFMSAHWHPLAKNSEVEFPHYHFGAAALTPDGGYLARAHIPSPRVSLEAFIRLMIRDLGITPARDDWEERLAQSETVFAEHRSWPK
jgi:hypothetical protein